MNPHHVILLKLKKNNGQNNNICSESLHFFLQLAFFIYVLVCRQQTRIVTDRVSCFWCHVVTPSWPPHTCRCLAHTQRTHTHVLSVLGCRMARVLLPDIQKHTASLCLRLPWRQRVVSQSTTSIGWHVPRWRHLRQCALYATCFLSR